jgi:predicted dienelactone hydrolase
MKAMLQKVLLVALSGFALAFVGCGGGDDETAPVQSLPATGVSPLALPGPHTVACSNIAQDFSRVLPGEDAKSYWEGTPAADGAPRDVTDLLADPANTPSVIITAPNDANLYGSFAGQQLEFVLLACYPTVADNPRADYPLPTGDVVPHMQVGADPPLLADSTTRYPMLAFAHGYRGSPLTSDYLASMSVFASYGYIVVAPFYGDPHFTDLTFDNLSDAVALLANLSDFTALQALRALATSAAIDLLLSDPQWLDHIDATRIGGFGASMGGETLLLLGGAGLTSSLDFAQSQVTVDPRLKAAVGYVPFFGGLSLPAFGRDQSGLDSVTLPFLAISGTADTLAPIIMAEQGINRLAGTRELVSLAGVTHGFDVASTNDIYTWALTFLDAELRENPAARLQLATMTSVAGGGDDNVVIPYNGPVVD